MNIKRILSTALVAVMLFTAIVGVIPFEASAAYSESSATAGGNVPAGFEEANLNSEELAAYMNEYLTYDFASASEMLNYELKCGYLYYANSPGKNYTMFINKYTGFLYYVNNVTGQILTSNPINPKSASSLEDRQILMSQVLVKFAELDNSTNYSEYNSVKWAASRAQISVSAISGGLRVNYTLGDTTARFLLPGRATAEQFEGTILLPMINTFVELMEEYCTDEYPDVDFNFVDNEEYNAYEYSCINYSTNDGLKRYLTDMQKIYPKVLKNTSAEYKQIDALRVAILQITGSYALNVPEKYIGNDRYESLLETMYKDYPITKDGTAIYVYSGAALPEVKRPLANLIKEYCSDYTFALMYEQEKECGYVDDSAQKPVFRCAIEYTFNADSSLSVRLPASSITFDETVYTLDRITPLQYFGGANMVNDGYVFYPDGSGTIIDFNDFYGDTKKVGIVLEAPIYGIDYSYSSIDGIAGISHREQVTMPVYGMVNEVKASEATALATGKETVTNGYLAIIEEGSALANLMVKSGGVSHSYIGAYAYYTPYPSDIYDLSETLSVGSLGVYKIVSKSKYTGSYVTRYVMLSDDEVGTQYYGENSFYASDYIGMATYYRDYLKNNGVIKALESLNEELPLYIEVLGSMDITSKFLSFPVTENIPLTTFNNVSTIYEELSKCEEFVIRKIAEYQELARTEEDAVQKYQYEKQAERYSELVGKISNIKNINFKLTGFANGGMKSTYPVKLKWVKACGGKSGFKALVKNAQTVSASGSENFSVYPDFDFMYINDTALFDGISIDKIASVMVDNRYASKQVYNSVMQEYETFETLLVSSDALAKLYSKFQSKYSSYNYKNLSVSTMGESLNSNFDKKNSINREDAMGMVENILDTMVNKNGYTLMTDAGNIYAVEYATHILNASIDSSHHRYTSYTIPFTGLILHSYVNYTGEPINYSGSPAYDRLRAIENGAALYYIVCFQNTSYMKDDENLSKYYGVDYHNWFDDIVENYKVLNDLIGDLQYYEIVDHDILIAEREIEADEMSAKYVVLQDALIELLEKQFISSIDKALASLKGDSANYEKRIKFTVDVSALELVFSEILNLSVDEFDVRTSQSEYSFSEKITALVGKYESYYAGAFDANGNPVSEKTVTVDFEYSIEAMLLDLLEEQLSSLVEEALPGVSGATREEKCDNLKLTVDSAYLVSRFAKILGITVSELDAEFVSEVDALIAKYTSKYDGFHNEEGVYDAYYTTKVNFSRFVYTADAYVTDSYAQDEDYLMTDFTVDNGNVTMVTYKKGDSVVRFILNYNNYRVTVRLSATEEYVLEAYGCEKIVD